MLKQPRYSRSGGGTKCSGTSTYKAQAMSLSRVPASCPPGFQGRYTVQPGDTMFTIAQRFGVSLDALIAANPQISNPNLIFPGDVLCVPGAPLPDCRVPASCPPGFQGRYTVQPGDTMFTIAQRFGVSLQALINANPQITNPNLIFPCDVLCVPGAAPPCRVPATCPPGFQGRYTVQPGDTMFIIAQRFGVSLQALINANPQITNPNLIFPCDVLCVPGPPVGGRVPVSCPTGFTGRYTVRPGDTMFSIAQMFGVSLQALIAANPHITNPDQIFPCDVLCVPCPTTGRVPTTCPTGFQGQYTVQAGDSMFSIAQMFGVSLQALIAANPQITNPGQIFPCDVLCVPCPPFAEPLPPPKLVLPCCVVLQPTFQPMPGSAPGGVALVQSLPTKWFRVCILAVDLPWDTQDESDADAEWHKKFEGVVIIPGKKEITFPLFRCQKDPAVWSGCVEFDSKTTLDTKVAVRQIKKKGHDDILLQAVLKRCGCAPL
ncbi:MAG: LysM peptidoglycan-binding domain-containing protein [Bacillota bacterium]